MENGCAETRHSKLHYAASYGPRKAHTGCYPGAVRGNPNAASYPAHCWRRDESPREGWVDPIGDRQPPRSHPIRPYRPPLHHMSDGLDYPVHGKAFGVYYFRLIIMPALVSRPRTWCRPSSTRWMGTKTCAQGALSKAHSYPMHTRDAHAGMTHARGMCMQGWRS